MLHELKLGNETWKNTAFLPSLKLTAKAPKLELEWMVGVLIPFWVRAYFSGPFAVSFREGIIQRINSFKGTKISPTPTGLVL